MLSCSGNFPSVANNPAAHVALMCWTFSRTANARTRLNSIFVALRHSSTMEQFKTFSGEALSRKTLIPDRFISRCCATLLAEDLLDDELVSQLHTIGWFFLHPEMKKIRAQNKDVAFVMLCAAQRQVCSGSEARVWNVITYTFQHLV